MSKNYKLKINECLLSAVENGDLPKIEQLFKQGADPDYIKFHKLTVSEIFLDDKISETKKIKIIKLFLINKVKVNFASSNFLNQIVVSGYEKLAKILIVNAGDINYSLRDAARKGCEKLVSLMLNVGIELTQLDKGLLLNNQIGKPVKNLLSQAIDTDKLFDKIFTKEQIGISLSNQAKPSNHDSSFQKGDHEHDKESTGSDLEMSINYSFRNPSKKVTNAVPPEKHNLSLGARFDIGGNSNESVQTIKNSNEEKSKILPERFNAILNKKISNIFKSCVHDKLEQKLIDAFSIKTTDESNQKIDENNLINSLQNLFEKLVVNLKQAGFSEKND